ncbi:uncharacterized protein LOC134059447 isoform X3 [Sardina pilchardus]|uniref:uncharacterized protein LOC134059447 isoform X3 n=1 Tax=Sardina pilchardus TaxID=27697 RepID=UPI002E1386C3
MDETPVGDGPQRDAAPASGHDLSNMEDAQTHGSGIQQRLMRTSKDTAKRIQWRVVLGGRISDHPLWSSSSNGVQCSKNFTPDTLDHVGQTIPLRDDATQTRFDVNKKKSNRCQGKERKSNALKRKSNLTQRKRKPDVSKNVSDVVVRSKRPRKRKRCSDKNQNAEDAEDVAGIIPDLPDSRTCLMDQALAAELLELVSGTVAKIQKHQRVSRGLQNDHSGLSLPSDPAQLAALVHGLTKNKQRDEDNVLFLRKSLEAKEQQLQENKARLEERHNDLEAKISSLDVQLLQERDKTHLLQEELKEARVQLESSHNTILFLSSQQNQKPVPPRPKPSYGALSARMLSRGPAKWVRFFTGFESYARFQAFVAFLQSGDSTLLVQSSVGMATEGEEEEERKDDEEDETQERERENGPPHTDGIDQESTPPTQDDYSALFQEEEEEEEATAESVRMNLKAQLRQSSMHVLPLVDELLLVLVRLRLGLLVQDSAFRFHVIHSTAGRVWADIMGLMQRRLQQVPVRGSHHYISRFQPQHSLHLGAGQELAVLECTDLLFDAMSRDRKALAQAEKQPSEPREPLKGRGSRKTSKLRRADKADRADRAGKAGKAPAAVSKRSSSSKPCHRPYRYLCPQRGCVVASPEGHLGFCSATRLEDWEDWAAEPEGPEPDAMPALPPYLVGDKRGFLPVPDNGTPCLQVLSVQSLTNKVHNFRFLRMVHVPTPNIVDQIDRAWEVCCYLACLQSNPMGLR